MRIFTKIFFYLAIILPAIIKAQAVTGWAENFNDGNISRWNPGATPTYRVSADNGTLKIDYARTATSDAWDNFNYTPPKVIDINNNPVIVISIKSTVNTTLSIKPVYETDVPLIAKTITGDGAWHTIRFNVTSPGSKSFNKIYMYFDANSSSGKTGTIWFDDLRMGDSVGVNTPADFIQFDKAILAAQLLITNTLEGSNEGQYKYGSKKKLLDVYNSVKKLKDENVTDQKVVDKGVWDLYDACVSFETSVNGIPTTLIDPTPTRETRYLYAHLFDLSTKALLFGMHDATGYGVGWSGDDNRSDIKDVCGDFPAIFSEDMNVIETENQVDRLIYRLTNAYKGGAVITMVWHQLDHTGTHFYPEYLSDPMVVEKYIPGGSYHQQYKEKLHRVASFLKSFRGPKGESIPVIFRPYHEHLQSPFWWGVAYCSAEQYNQLWRFTVNYLRDTLNVHNLIWTQSPMLNDIDNGDEYTTKRYPGDNYIDIFGVDDYEVFKNSGNIFANSLRALAKQALAKNKIAAIAEIGEEGVKLSGLFSDHILAPIKSDSLTSTIVYTNVWRNQSTSHFFAPYPGHSSVPDFIKYYNDPYTLFMSDLPKMYQRSADLTSPVFVSRFDSVFVSASLQTKIEIKTDKRAFLKYSFNDGPYTSMTGDFQSGQGGLSHTLLLSGMQGEVTKIYVKGQDLWGNETQNSLIVAFRVDTTQVPVAWTNNLYVDKGWKQGLTPIGSGSTASTVTGSVSTAYFRKKLTLTEVPKTLGLLVQAQGGAAVYVNNKELGRVNLPVGVELAYSTEPTATSALSKIFILDTLALKNLHTGENLFAIEVHAGTTGSVTGFNAKLFNPDQTYIPLGTDWKYFAEGYRPNDMKLSDITIVAQKGAVMPAKYELFANYPNPFNPTTNIRYELARDTKVTVAVFDILGRNVITLVNQEQRAGAYEVQFDAAKLSSGTYIVVMSAGEFFKTMKMVLLK